MIDRSVIAIPRFRVQNESYVKAMAWLIGLGVVCTGFVRNHPKAVITATAITVAIYSYNHMLNANSMTVGIIFGGIFFASALMFVAVVVEAVIDKDAASADAAQRTNS